LGREVLVQFRLGENVFDGERRILLRGNKSVHLSPKAFRLLEYLLEHRPKALSKADIQAAVWPDVFVSEANLAIRVNELRRAIGDDCRKPRFIRTVYGFGYAFSGEVVGGPGTGAPATGSLHRLHWGRHEADLSEGENVLGRDADAAVWVADASASRRHALIRVTGPTAALEDLGSKNGTLCNGVRVAGSVSLRNGDEIRIGRVTFQFRTISATASTASRSSRSAV
jgi:DNA-binding winged helix-turn-helix (wHTH) protein